MQQIKTIATAITRVTWDKIPDEVIFKYEDGMAKLRACYKGRKYKTFSIQLYNELFGVYGYTKSV